MKKRHFYSSLLSALVFFLILSSCKKDDAGTPSPSFSVAQSEIVFQGTVIGQVSAGRAVSIQASNLTSDVSVQASTYFEVSKDNTTFASSISLTNQELNGSNTTIYVRFAPPLTELGEITGTLVLSSSDFQDKTVNLRGTALEIPREITVLGSVDAFEGTTVSTASASKSVQIKGLNLTGNVTALVTDGFEISKDDTTFSTSLNFDYTGLNAAAEDLYIRFTPGATDLGEKTGTITLSASDVSDVVINLSGTGTPVIHNYVAFDSERIAFGGGYSQSSEQSFTLHNDLTNIEKVKMFVKLRCPATVGCDEWDVFAHIQVKDPSSGEWYELGRYITPYWIDNSALPRGFEYDVTDFKSLLTGTVELRAYIEVWNDRGYELTVDFDYEEGTPDYPYYAVSRLLHYNTLSIGGVPYGVDISSYDLTKSAMIPANSESTHMRTIITGWGHATPNDPDGRPCAEWCYRTHDVLINGTNTFTHDMGPLGCASNPVSPQGTGNWAPDRAGWCPGMEVPTRIDNFATPMAGSTFTYEYDFEDWTNDMAASNPNAYYAISSYVVVKSNTPINKPTVTE